MPNWKSIKLLKEVSLKDEYFIYFEDKKTEVVVFNNLEEIKHWLNISPKPLLFQKIKYPETPTTEELENCDRIFKDDIQIKINSIQDKIMVLMSGTIINGAKVNRLKKKLTELKSQL